MLATLTCPQLAAEQSAKIGGIVSGYARGLSGQAECLAEDAIQDAWVRELERETAPLFEPEGETTRRIVGWAKHLLRRWEAQGGQRQESAVRLHYLDDAAMARAILEEYELSAALDDYEVADLAAFIERVLRPDQLHWLRVVRGELPWPTWPEVNAPSARRLRRQEVRADVTRLVRAIVADLLGPEGGKPEPKRRASAPDSGVLARWQSAGTARKPRLSTAPLDSGLEPLVVTDELRAASFASLSCAAQKAAVAARPSLARFL